MFGKRSVGGRPALRKILRFMPNNKGGSEGWGPSTWVSLIPHRRKDMSLPTRPEKGRAGACVSARFTCGGTRDNFCRPHRACVRWRGGARGRRRHANLLLPPSHMSMEASTHIPRTALPRDICPSSIRSAALSRRGGGMSLSLIWTGPGWLISSSDPAAFSNGQRDREGERVSEIWGGDGIGCIAFLHSEHEEWRRKGVFALPAPSVHFLAHVGHFAGRADITMTRCAPLRSQPVTLSIRRPRFWSVGLVNRIPSRTPSSTG